MRAIISVSVKTGITDFTIYKVDRRVGIVFGMQLKCLFISYQPGHFAIRVIQVAEGQCPGGTGVNAGGSGLAVNTGLEPLCQAVIDAFGAEVAFLGSTDLMRV